MTRAVLLAAALATVLGSTAQAQDPSRSCTAFQRPNFGGEAWHLKTNGQSARSHLDNRISSFKMRSGCHVQAWMGENFTGRNRTWSQDVARVGDEWNDKITSWKCVCSNL